MKKRTFHYCGTHRQDEAYMQQMCAQGWAATGLIEGFWTFEPCAPNAYCYRVCYLRGLKKSEIWQLQQDCARRGIEFVSRYSFWAIFRSPQPFSLYTKEEDRAICRKIYRPMPIGAAVSWLVCALGLFLSFRVSLYFLILSIPAGLYGAMCTWLGISYRRLLKTL